MDLTLGEGESLIEESFSRFLRAESAPKFVRAAKPLGFDAGLREKAVSMRALGLPRSREPGSR